MKEKELLLILRKQVGRSFFFF